MSFLERSFEVTVLLYPDSPRQVKKVFFPEAKTAERAKDKVMHQVRNGRILTCKKVDYSYYLAKIEHLNLKQPVLIDDGSVQLGKGLELMRPPRKQYEDKKDAIEIVDNDEEV